VRGAGTRIIPRTQADAVPLRGDSRPGRSSTLAGMRIGRRDVTLTNLDKVFFPRGGLTKGDLIRYYVDLARRCSTTWSAARCR